MKNWFYFIQSLIIKNFSHSKIFFRNEKRKKEQQKTKKQKWRRY